VQPARHDLHEGDAAGARAGGAGRRAALARAHSGRPDRVMGAVAFVIIAGIAVGSALGLVFKRNPIHAALFLVVNLGAVAVLYLTLGAEFLAVAQIAVYAGAIMVLFLFAIFVLIPAREETTPDPRRSYRILALPVGAPLLSRRREG